MKEFSILLHVELKERENNALFFLSYICRSMYGILRKNIGLGIYCRRDSTHVDVENTTLNIIESFINKNQCNYLFRKTLN